MLRQCSARLRWRSLGCALILIALCFNGAVGCSARKASAPPPAAAQADVANAAALPQGDAAIDDNDEPKETCEGALDCTFFGLGAVLAAPFWVLGTVLGLTL